MTDRPAVFALAFLAPLLVTAGLIAGYDLSERTKCLVQQQHIAERTHWRMTTEARGSAECFQCHPNPVPCVDE